MENVRRALQILTNEISSERNNILRARDNKWSTRDTKLSERDTGAVTLVWLYTSFVLYMKEEQKIMIISNYLMRDDRVIYIQKVRTGLH